MYLYSLSWQALSEQSLPGQASIYIGITNYTSEEYIGTFSQFILQMFN